MSAKVQGIHGRGTSRDEGARPRAEGGSAREQEEGGRGKRPAREDSRDAGTGSHHGRAAPCHHQSQRAGPLSPKTWYGMPAYAKDGKVVCFFQSAQKFDSRYATLGFSDEANLDEGAMWPTSFALKELTAAEEAKISALVKSGELSQLLSLAPRTVTYDREGGPAGHAVLRWLGN